ncbi:hypothetical protein DL93DRAFT_2074198, partial [Clavulina sp. PMI_390]
MDVALAKTDDDDIAYKLFFCNGLVVGLAVTTGGVVRIRHLVWRRTGAHRCTNQGDDVGNM